MKVSTNRKESTNPTISKHQAPSTKYRMEGNAMRNLPFKALADPTRRKIILLLKKGDMTAGEIAEHFEMTKPSVSHHLKILKQAMLVTDERKGQNILYALDTTVFQEMVNWFYNAARVNEGENERKNVSEKVRDHGGAEDE